jgi:hypothetical protein
VLAKAGGGRDLQRAKVTDVENTQKRSSAGLSASWASKETLRGKHEELEHFHEIGRPGYPSDAAILQSSIAL